jgi:molybdopterin-containing oxidoreductase family membrane subunit
MTTTTSAKQLPYGVARLNTGWYVTIAVLLVLVGLGAFAYLTQLVEGEIVTGMRDIGTMAGAPWGMYIAFVVYFIGVSFAGITIAVLIRLLGMDHLKPIARMAEVLTVIALILGSLCIIADVGQPGRAIINLFRYARPQSPFFGTFTLVVSGYMFASLVYLYLDSRADAAKMAKNPGKLQGFYRVWAAGWRGTPAELARRRISSFWLAIAILPLLVVAHSTLGFVFGLQVGRPGWFGGLQAPGFVILAGVSGLGMLIIIAAILRKVLKLEEQFSLDIFKFLGNFLMALTVAYLYFMVVEMLTAVYVAGPHEAAINQALLFGQYAGIFWLSTAFLVISFVLLFVQFARNRYGFGLAVLAGVLVNLAAIGKRYLIVIPSQTHGSLLPYTTGTYSPSWVEVSIIVGLFALGALLFIMFMKLFPIMELAEATEGGQS